MAIANTRWMPKFALILFFTCSSWPANAGGSWGNQIGGSLKYYFYTTGFSSLWSERDFVTAEVFRVYKDAGLGIAHEFIGILTTWKLSDGTLMQKPFTTGLVAAGDGQFFKKALVEDHSVLVPIYTLQNREIFENLVRKMNEMMRQHPANVSCRLSFRMVATPIFGQPCTNAVDALLALRP